MQNLCKYVSFRSAWDSSIFEEKEKSLFYVHIINHHFTFKREQLTFTESWPMSGFFIFLNFILIKAVSFLILSNGDLCCDTFYHGHSLLSKFKSGNTNLSTFFSGPDMTLSQQSGGQTYASDAYNIDISKQLCLM